MKHDGIDAGYLMSSVGKPQQRAAAGTEEALGHAWRREMERAQMEAWLAHGVVGFSPFAPPMVPTASAMEKNSPAFVPDARDTNESIPQGVADAPAHEQASQHDTVLRQASPPARLDVAQDRASTHVDACAVIPVAFVTAALDAAPASAPADATAPAAVPAPVTAADHPPSHAQTEQQKVESEEVFTVSPPEREVLLRHAQTAQIAEALESVGIVYASLAVGRDSPDSIGGSFLRHDLPVAIDSTDRHMRGASLPQNSERMVPDFAQAAAGARKFSAVLGAAAPFGAPLIGTRRDVAASVAPQQRLQARLPGAAPAQPIRLHADWSVEGVRLWLGMDAALLPDVQPIAAQLQRWLASQGVRLLSIACNGRPLTTEGLAVADASHPDHNTSDPAEPSAPIPVLRRSHGNQFN